MQSEVKTEKKLIKNYEHKRKNTKKLDNEKENYLEANKKKFLKYSPFKI